jgi:hypothetical protein
MQGARSSSPRLDMPSCIVAARFCVAANAYTGLRMIPLVPGIPPMTKPTTAVPHMAMATNVAATSMAGSQAGFFHQAVCSPPTPILLRALAQSSELTTIPGLTPHLIIHHLLSSTATNNGHMQRYRQGVQITRMKQPAILQAHADLDCLQPIEELCSAHNMFCFTALVELDTGMVYINGAGAFPV